MSEVRAHFCTEVARLCSGMLSPRKYGLNWFMPALASSSVGSEGISELDGTTWWSRAVKKPVKIERMSVERMEGPHEVDGIAARTAEPGRERVLVPQLDATSSPPHLV